MSEEQLAPLAPSVGETAFAVLGVLNLVLLTVVIVLALTGRLRLRLEVLDPLLLLLLPVLGPLLVLGRRHRAATARS